MNPGKLLVFAAALALAGGALAQTTNQPPPRTAPQTFAVPFPELPSPSPLCTNAQRVGFTEIIVVYSRPSMRRHTIFGGIVPYGDLWRTGDNAPTKITFTSPVKLGPEAIQIPAGTYALFTIPEEKTWTIILNKGTGGWGKDNYDVKQDVVRFKVAPAKLTEAVDSFTIDVNDLQDDSATINLNWARVRVPIKVQVDVLNDLFIKIQVSMDSSSVKSAATYLKAATFFFEHTSQDHPEYMTRALGWVNAGLVNAPAPASYHLLYLKARILAKQGDHDGARLAAQQSTQQAIETEGLATPYVKLNKEVTDNLR